MRALRARVHGPRYIGSQREVLGSETALRGQYVQLDVLSTMFENIPTILGAFRVGARRGREVETNLDVTSHRRN